MAIQFSCPSCHTPYTVDDKNAGKKSNCAKCGQRIQVPAPVRNKTVLGESVSAAPVVMDLPAAAPGKIAILCPGCGHRAEVAAHFAGSVAKCPKCDTSFTIGERIPATDRTDELQASPVASDESGRSQVEDDFRNDYSPSPRRRPNAGQGLAIVGLILGILGIVISILSGAPFVCTVCSLGCCAFLLPISWLLCAISGLLGVVGTILGVASRNAGNRSVLSTLAIVGGAIAIIFAIIGLVITLLFPVAVVATTPPPQPTQPNADRPETNKPPAEKTDTQRPPAKRTETPKPPPAGKKTYTRDEFRRLVIGKTPNAVTMAVGKPDDTQNLSASVVWYYDRITTDPATGKADAQAQVIFENGKVVRVNY
jgi:predicted Zn finger-like uncharacterized protein